MTDYKKKKIRKLAKEYAELIKNPQNFTSRKVGKNTAGLLSTKYSYSGNDYRVTNGHVIIATRRKKTVKIKGDKLMFKYADGRTETIYTRAKGVTLLEQISKMREPKLKSGERWGIKIGDHTVFSKSLQNSLKELVEASKGHGSFGGAIRSGQAELVKVHFPGLEDDEEVEE